MPKSPEGSIPSPQEMKKEASKVLDFETATEFADLPILDVEVDENGNIPYPYIVVDTNMGFRNLIAKEGGKALTVKEALDRLSAGKPVYYKYGSGQSILNKGVAHNFYKIVGVVVRPAREREDAGPLSNPGYEEGKFLVASREKGFLEYPN